MVVIGKSEDVSFSLNREPRLFASSMYLEINHRTGIIIDGFTEFKVEDESNNSLTECSHNFRLSPN